MLLAPIKLSDTTLILDVGKADIFEVMSDVIQFGTNAFVFAEVRTQDTVQLLWIGINEDNHLNNPLNRRRMSQLGDKIVYYVVDEVNACELRDNITILKPSTYIQHSRWMDNYAVVKNLDDLRIDTIYHGPRDNMRYMRFEDMNQSILYPFARMSSPFEAEIYSNLLQKILGLSLIGFYSLPRFSLTWWEKMAYSVLAHAERRRRPFFDY